MTPQEIDNLLGKGVLVANTVPKAQLEALAQKFAPMKTQHELIRLGPAKDGGYLVPNDLQDIRACFSPGVSYSALFEDDLVRQFGIGSHLADYSVDGPPHGFVPLSFTKKYLGAHNDATFMTLEKWVRESWEYDLGGDLLLQMDIEGAEYETLLATPDSILKKFRIVVLEIHDMELWGLPACYKIADALINKLRQHFVVVHHHPNNHQSIVSVNGVEFPRVSELTLIRKDRCQIIEPATQIPHPLDAPCGPRYPDIVLPKSFQLA